MASNWSPSHTLSPRHFCRAYIPPTCTWRRVWCWLARLKSVKRNVTERKKGNSSRKYVDACIFFFKKAFRKALLEKFSKYITNYKKNMKITHMLTVQKCWHLNADHCLVLITARFLMYISFWFFFFFFADRHLYYRLICYQKVSSSLVRCFAKATGCGPPFMSVYRCR